MLLWFQHPLLPESLICLQPVVGAVLNSSFDKEESNLHTSVAVIVQVLAQVNWSHSSVAPNSPKEPNGWNLFPLWCLLEAPRSSTSPATPEVWVHQRANMPLVPCIRTPHCNRTLRCTQGNTRTRYPADFSNFLTFALHSSTIWIHTSCASPFLGHRTNCTYPPGEKIRFPIISFVVPIGIGILINSKQRPLGKGNLNKEILPTQG